MNDKLDEQHYSNINQMNSKEGQYHVNDKVFPNQKDNIVADLQDNFLKLSMGGSELERKDSYANEQNCFDSKNLRISLEDNNQGSEFQMPTYSPFNQKKSDASGNDSYIPQETFFNPFLGTNGNLNMKPKKEREKSPKAHNYFGTNATSSMYSYFEPSQKYLSESLMKDNLNEDSNQVPESPNFIKKASIDFIRDEPRSYQDINNPFGFSYGHNAGSPNEEVQPNTFTPKYPNMKHNFFNQNNQQDNQDNMLGNPYMKNFNLTNPGMQNFQGFNPNKSKGSNNQYDFTSWNNQFNLKNNEEQDKDDDNKNEEEEEDDDAQNNSAHLSNGSLHSEDYTMEKYGKKGWVCEKYRIVCNRCGISKQPKLINKSKASNHNLFPNPFRSAQIHIQPLPNEEKKRKPFVERKGDWRCPQCQNLNFSFRQACNRCKTPKQPMGMMNLIGNMGMPFPPPQYSQQNNMYQNMLNNKINIYNNFYNMKQQHDMYQSMLNQRMTDNQYEQK